VATNLSHLRRIVSSDLKERIEGPPIATFPCLSCFHGREPEVLVTDCSKIAPIEGVSLGRSHAESMIYQGGNANLMLLYNRRPVLDDVWDAVGTPDPSWLLENCGADTDQKCKREGTRQRADSPKYKVISAAMRRKKPPLAENG
jgi:hypothetical protein